VIPALLAIAASAFFLGLLFPSWFHGWRVRAARRRATEDLRRRQAEEVRVLVEQIDALRARTRDLPTLSYAHEYDGPQTFNWGRSDLDVQVDRDLDVIREAFEEEDF